MATIKCRHSRNIFLDEFDLGDEGRQRGGVAETGAEQDDTDKQQRNARAGGEHESDRTGNLPHSRRRRPVGDRSQAASASRAACGRRLPLRSPVPSRVPPAGAPSAGTSSSEKRCAIRPIWAKSPKVIPAESVRNLRSRQSSEPGKGRADGDVTEAAAAPGSSPSGLSPIVSGVRENTRSANAHIVITVTTATSDAAAGKSHRADGSHPKRREDDSADTPAVVGHGECGRAGTHEPGRNDRIERRGTHRPPPAPLRDRCDEKMPRRGRGGPADDAGGDQQRAGFRYHRRAKAAVQSRQVRPGDRAGEEMKADRRGDEDDRPAPRFADDAQERWAGRRSLFPSRKRQERMPRGPPAIRRTCRACRSSSS